MVLTDEQRRRMEENRKRALEIRRRKQLENEQSGGGSSSISKSPQEERLGSGSTNNDRIEDSSQVEVESASAVETSLCKCGTQRTKLTAGETAKFPGRGFYNCNSCGKFDWADETPTKLFDDKAGPDCKCKKASVQRAVKVANSPNKGRKFWCCAKGKAPRGCGFFEWVDQSMAQSTGVTPRSLDYNDADKKRPALPGYASYLSDWKKTEVLQRMMEVDPKFMMSYTGSRYDSIEVVGTWKINNNVQQEQFDAARAKMKRESSKGNDDYGIPDTYSVPMNELANTPLNREAGEVILLHGTSPDNLHSILFEGHKTALANKQGLFGRGIYFAENAAKIDQYSTNDEWYQKDGNVGELHDKIYKGCGQMHPRNVRYALACRVLLGEHVTTSDGKTRLGDGENVFSTDDRNELASLPDGTTPGSLIAIPGERARYFREFMVYDESQVIVEYLVAYKRVRNLCECGDKCIERTVTVQTENHGRKIHLCPNNKRCAFMLMLPLCKCGKSATVKTSHSTNNPNRQYYGCYQRRGRACDFFEWKDASRAAASPSSHKRARTT